MPASNMLTANTRTAPITYAFVDDGTMPNNALPLVFYRAAIDLAGSPDLERFIKNTFAANGWGGLWRNGVYAYAYCYSMIHEAMGVARGTVTVRCGGDNGKAINIAPRDVVIVPAGSGHQRLAQSCNLVVVGAYPPGGKYDCHGSKAERAEALTSIPKAPLPVVDPVFGPTGPQTILWRS
jgi:uncharacterized protein YjlB